MAQFPSPVPLMPEVFLACFHFMSHEQLERIRRGDVAAFEELFRELHAQLCEVVDSYVRSQAVAEEIVQDLFFAVWMKRATLEATSFRGYLFRAARNRALHHQRHQSVVIRVSRLLQLHTDEGSNSGLARSADFGLDVEERRHQLRRAISELSPRARLAVTLRLDHELSDREIADSMGITAKGVEKLLSIARKKLKAELAGPDKS